MSIPKIKVLISALVLVHFFGNLWHGDAHATLEVTLPELKTAYVAVVIVIAPLIGATLTWTRFMRPGAWLVGMSMVGSVVFSVYHHYVMISIDNVEHLPAGTAQAHAHFSNSAELIALSALAAALVSFYGAGALGLDSGGGGKNECHRNTESPQNPGHMDRQDTPISGGPTRQ